MLRRCNIMSLHPQVVRFILFLVFYISIMRGSENRKDNPQSAILLSRMESSKVANNLNRSQASQPYGAWEMVNWYIPYPISGEPVSSAPGFQRAGLGLEHAEEEDLRWLALLAGNTYLKTLNGGCGGRVEGEDQGIIFRRPERAYLIHVRPVKSEATSE